MENSDGQDHENDLTPVERAFAEFLELSVGDERPDFEAFCRQHAEIAPGLRKLHEQYQLLRSSAVRIAGQLVDEHAAEPGSSSEQVPRELTELIDRLRKHLHAYSRYEHRGELARGGMGSILRVRDSDLNRDLAMKVVLGESDSRRTGETPEIDARKLARFLDEAQITGQLVHPGIVPVHELGVDEQGQLYFTMQLVKGRTLEEVLGLVQRGEEGWTLNRALGVIQRACEAVAYAHSEGVIHRDLKPSNIMVGEFGEVYVMDWGLARALEREETRDIRVREQPGPRTDDEELETYRRKQLAEDPDTPLLTRDGEVLGTPAYMSPEQAEGDLERVGPPSDVYSMGAILYHLLTGEAPYVHDGAKLSAHGIWRRVKVGPPPGVERLLARERPPTRIYSLKDLKPKTVASAIRDLYPLTPIELVAICEKAMARKPESRYPDISRLLEDLEAFREGRSVLAYRESCAGESVQCRFPALVPICFIFVDLGVLLCSCVVGYWIGTELGSSDVETPDIRVYRQVWALESAVCLASFLVFGMYKRVKNLFGWRDFRTVVGAVGVSFVVFWTLTILLLPGRGGSEGPIHSFLMPIHEQISLPFDDLEEGAFSRPTVIISFVLILVCISAWRAFAYSMLRRRHRPWHYVSSQRPPSLRRPW